VFTARREASVAPAIATYIQMNRSVDRYEQLAPLWRALLRRGPYRRRALTALSETMAAVEELSSDPHGQVEEFVVALAGSFRTDAEVAAFLREYPRTGPTSAIVREVLKKILENGQEELE
jgi:hypothetical protein